MSAVSHPVFARFLHLMRQREEQLGVAEHRVEMLAGATGRVVEVGAGDGANFGHYPPTVTEVVAVEPEPYLRRLAERAAAAAAVPVTVHDGTAEHLPLPDSSFDVAVVSLVMCSVAHPARAAAEVARVLRPGGELRFYEHVLADDPRLARWQRWGAPIQARVAGGCRPDRDTLATLTAAGFDVEQVRRFHFSPAPPMILAAPRVIGRARRVPSA